MATLVLGVVTACASHAQFGNDWINPALPYWSFPVAEDGVVELSYQNLLDAGVLAGPVLSDEIKVYHRGLQQRLWMDDSGDNTFGPEDRFWLLGRHNDGWLDAHVYDDPENHLHPDYSLFNDTATYYLAVHPGIPERAGNQSAAGADALSPEPFGWHTSTMQHTAAYHIGRQHQYGISLPWYESGEGWGAPRFGLGQTFNTPVPTPGAFDGPGAPDAEVYAVSVGASSALDNNPNHHLQVGSASTTAVDTAFYGYLANKLDFTLSSPLDPTTTVWHRSVDDLDVATDFQAVVSVAVRYPRLWQAPEGLLEMEVQAQPGTAEARIDVPDWDGTGYEVFVVRLDLQTRLEVDVVDGNARMVVPLAGGGATLWFVPESAITAPTALTPVSSTGTFTDFDNAPDSAFVIIAPDALMPAAQSYAFYRESLGTPVILASAEELYHQFGAGVSKHPLAFRRFANYLIQNGDYGPAHLLLLGKSVHEANVSNQLGGRQNPEVDALNLLPTWGWPASDIIFTAGLNGTQYQPAIPTGRIAARTTEEVLDYLDKVIAFENSPPARWQKRILHFGGGGNTNEQQLFQAYLESYEWVARDSLFGADIRAFYKDTTDPIQLQLGDSITDLISEGCALMTFFGHASATGFDQNIDDPSNYDNVGRYPLLIGNSCYTGNIHLADANSTSERFTRVANAGVIGFIAKGDMGIPGYLDIWTQAFYEEIFRDNFGTTIGRAMKAAAGAVEGGGTVSLAVNTALTFGLHGDPSLTLYHREYPDFKITPTSVYTMPEAITTQLDSFDVFVVVDNLGKARNLPVGVEVVRTLPDGSEMSQTRVLDRIFFCDTAVFRFPVERLLGPGDNSLDVFVDFPASLVDELDDTGNNTVTDWPFFVRASNVLPAYPYDHSILPEPPEYLVVGTGDPYFEGGNLLMEISDTPEFTGAVWEQNLTYVTGGLFYWDPVLTLEPGTTYFWRTSLEPVQGDPDWSVRSFRIASGESGFGQHVPTQFAANSLTGLDTDGTTLTYATQTADLTCTVHGNPSTQFDLLDTNFQLGLEVMDYAGCAGTPAFHVAVLDSVTLLPWETNYAGANPDYDFGNYMACSNARARPERYFIFRMNQPAEMQGLVDLLENYVPEGNHLLLYTYGFTDYDAWDANAPELYDLMQELGFGQIGQSADSIPFIGYVRKGFPETSAEVLGTAIDDVIELQLPLTGSSGSGVMASPWMGVGQNWDLGSWDFASADSDSVRVVVRGRDASGVTSTAALIDLPLDPLSLITPLAQATEIQLLAELWDPGANTVSQPAFWQVTADHLPDAAVNPNAGSFQSGTNVEAGAEIGFAVAVSNTSPHAMDSLLVRHWIEGPEGQTPFSITHRLDSLRVGAQLTDTAWFNTELLSGAYTWWFEVNPITEGTADQPEQHRFNNTAFRSFTVEADQENPLLDVSFDGRHILDGELISPTPEVRILLRDGNTNLLMDTPQDTSRFKLFVHTPAGMSYPVYFDQEELEFIPATGTENRAEAHWNPRFEEDGMYQLMVQAEDRSGNSAGPDYRISFEVETEAAITQVLNYPNPFTSSTRFVFTLTGETVPDELVIQIFTISGKVVREITQDELGLLRIGPNITDFAWDGTDMFGDPLATGVYLYRVIARQGGTDLSLRASDADPLFQQGIGKMYLIRQ